MNGSVHGSVHGWCMGAWEVHGLMVCCGVGECMCVLPGLVRLDFGVGEGLDGDGEEVVPT